MSIKLICSDGGWVVLDEVEVQRCNIWNDLMDVNEMIIPFTAQVVLALRDYLTHPKISKPLEDVQSKQFGEGQPAALWVHQKWRHERQVFFELLNLSNFLDIPCLLHLTTFQVAHALTHTDKREWQSLLR